MAAIDFFVPIAVHGPTGATAATRYAGATASGAPVSGTFAKGDYVIAQDGHAFVCTVAGSPGTWVDVAGGGGGITQLTGDVTAGPGSGSQAATLAASGVAAGTYGDSTHVAQVTVDAKGRATSAANVAISGAGVAPPGSVSLVYRKTLSATQAAIDTGVDAPDAGTNDWTNGDLLEIWITCRNNQAVPLSDCLVQFNNDSGSNYLYERIRASTNTVSANQSSSGGTTNIDIFSAGSSAAANVFTAYRISIPQYMSGSMWKAFEASGGRADGVSGSDGDWTAMSGAYKSLSAISRCKIFNNSTFVFSVGTTLTIYKRIAS